MGEPYRRYRMSLEKQKKVEKYRNEVAGLEKIPIRCPSCGTIADMVYADAYGHKDIRCWKCKYVFVTSLPYFRTVKDGYFRNR